MTVDDGKSSNTSTKINLKKDQQQPQRYYCEAKYEEKSSYYNHELESEPKQ